MPSAPATENTARPVSVLTPSRLAPAAPAKAPFGIACAANVEPRSTAKNPTIPAMTATIVAAIQVFIMKPLNMPSPRARPAQMGPPPPERPGPSRAGRAGAGR